MNISTLLLLLLSFTTLYSTRADQVVLLDTRTATAELNWKTWSNQQGRDGWLEETTYSEEQKVNHRIFSTCDVGHVDTENWLLVPPIDSRGKASRINVEIGYNIAKCEKLLALSKRQMTACRETMNLYAMTLKENEQLSKNWFNDSKWEYLETLVVKSERESDTKHVLLISYSLKDQSERVHFALKNTGACVAVLYIKLYYNFCPETANSFIHLPRTFPVGDTNALVTVVGNCVPNASPSINSVVNDISLNARIITQPPAFICKMDGSWQPVGSSSCLCNPGYIPSLKTNLCTACGIGTYKSLYGSGECTQCPEHSTSHRLGSSICECDAGYQRFPNETITQPCKHKKSNADKNSELIIIEEPFTGGQSPNSGPSNYEASESSSKTNEWFNGLLSVEQFWLWIFVCIVLTLILCCVLLTITRYSIFNRKQLSDMDALDSYKQDINSPDYSRSYNGQVPVVPRLISHKSNLPLISAYNTTQRANPSLMSGVHLLNNSRFKPYVDPSTYEDPRQALDDFTNEINVECVNVTRVIGAGEFGEVCSGRLLIEDAYGQHHEHIVAVKTLLPGSSIKAKSDFLMEALRMGQFEHENVIRLLGVVTKTEPVMILTEYMMNGSLDRFLKANDNSIETFQLVQMMHGIACGMKYLTDKGYVHRDLAARNVLVDDRLICKIADFGLSRGLTDTLGEQEYTTRNSEKIPIRWTAPEAIAHSKYTAASDVWSYGVVMWEILSYGDRPYSNWTNHKVIDEVRTGYRLSPPPNTSHQLGELMRRCWAIERYERPSFGQLVEELNNYINDEFYFRHRPSPTRFIHGACSLGR